MNNTKEPDLKVSPEADAAMAELVELFSDPSLASKARFRCGTEGPDEFDVLFDVFMNSDLFPEFQVSGERLKPRRENQRRDHPPREKRGAPIEIPRIDSCAFHPCVSPGVGSVNSEEWASRATLKFD